MTDMKLPESFESPHSEAAPLTFLKVWMHFFFLLFASFRPGEIWVNQTRALLITKSDGIIASVFGTMFWISIYIYCLSLSTANILVILFALGCIALSSLVLTYFWYVFRPNAPN